MGELDEDQTESARERFTLLVEQSLDDRTLMDAINDLASGLRRIAWLGPLSELAELSDDFASGLRAFFWSQYDGDEDDPEAWVPEDLWPQLVECAEEYMVEGRLLSHLVPTLAARRVGMRKSIWLRVTSDFEPHHKLR